MGNNIDKRWTDSDDWTPMAPLEWSLIPAALRCRRGTQFKRTDGTTILVGDVNRHGTIEMGELEPVGRFIAWRKVC